MGEFKFADWRLTVFWIGVALVALITGFVLGWCWRDRPGALADVSILSVMTAVGTVGAAVAAVAVALWQAHHAGVRDVENRRQAKLDDENRRNRLAALAAAALEPRLKVIEDDVDLVLIGLQVYGSTDITPEVFNSLSSQFLGIDLGVPLEHLLLIEVLPGECADDIAAGLARLSKVRSDMSRWHEAMYDRSNTGEHRMRLVEKWSDEIAVALGTISEARAELAKSTQTNLRHADFDDS